MEEQLTLPIDGIQEEYLATDFDDQQAFDRGGEEEDDDDEYLSLLERAGTVNFASNFPADVFKQRIAQLFCDSPKDEEHDEKK